MGIRQQHHMVCVRSSSSQSQSSYHIQYYNIHKPITSSDGQQDRPVGAAEDVLAHKGNVFGFLFLKETEQGGRGASTLAGIRIAGSLQSRIIAEMIWLGGPYLTSGDPSTSSLRKKENEPSTSSNKFR